MTGQLIATDGYGQWLTERRKGITASEVAIVMGLSPYSSPYALYWQKLGQLPQQEDNVGMELGRFLEDFVCRKFADLHPEFGVGGNGRQLYAHPSRPWQLATPDRLIREVGRGLDPVAVLEAKTAASYDGWGEDGSDEIPVHYRCQVLWQMEVMGVHTGYVAALFLHTRQLRVYEITDDDQARGDLKLMRDEAWAFLRQVEYEIPPDVDWRPATAAALKHLHPSVEDTDVPVRRMPIIQYRAAVRAYKAAEQRKKLAENRLRLLLGNGHRIVSAHTGEVIARRDVYPVKEHVRKATTVDKLVPIKASKEPSE